MFASELPPAWRAGAAAADPAHVDPDRLVESMAHDPGFTTTFVAAAGELGLTVLVPALARAPLAIALSCAEQIAARVAPARGLGVLWPVILRLAPGERLVMLERYAPGDGAVPGEWADAFLDAYVATLLETRGAREPLPRLDGRAFDAAKRLASARVTRWQHLARDLHPPTSRLGPTTAQLERAVVAAVEMPDATDADAALELVVDMTAESVVDHRDSWAGAMLLLQGLCGEHGDLFAARVARAALRPASRGDRSRLARWTLRWLADGLDRKALSSSALRDPAVAGLHELLLTYDIDRVIAYSNEEGRRRSTRRWLQDNARYAIRRLER